MAVPAIILAAGASRRLGQPKQLVQVDGETLLARTIRVVLASGAAPVLVVLGANQQTILSEVDFGAVQVVPNPAWEQGIASSIQSGILALRQRLPEVSGAMILVCDQPRLTADHLRALITAFKTAQETGIVSSTYAGLAGIPAIFPASHFPRLLALTGDTGARQILRNPGGPLVAIPFDGGEDDIDTPEDIAALHNPLNPSQK